jgi:hypothetical protein
MVASDALAMQIPSQQDHGVNILKGMWTTDSASQNYLQPLRS